MNRSYSLVICTIIYLLAFVFAALFIYYFSESVNKLLLAFLADLIATLVVFTFSVVFKNASLYDPYWSVAPPLIAFYWIEFGGTTFTDDVMLGIILFWAVRLTLNWVRGWKGLQHEDWRYKMLREKNPKMYWLTNLAGIHLFPTVMVFLGLLPVYYADKLCSLFIPCEGCGFDEIIFVTGAVISLMATVVEFIADEQMRAFKKSASPEEFINKGLWKYSRHPNYFGEMSFWFGLWVMQMAIAPEYWWTAVGFIAMLLMFLFASIPMMEEKNRKSKTAYGEYVKRVSVLFPLPPKRL